MAGVEAGYLIAGPAPGPAAAQPFAGSAERAYDGAPNSAVPDAGSTREADDTSPIPVIRDTGHTASKPGPGELVLAADPAPGREPPPAPAQEKLEQIKDLYLTAEAIGEDALVKHFEQLSQRQRALIREYFERAGLRAANPSTRLGDGGTAPDGASLPG
jgi:hypothetical protein